jgi:hypothetical protein
MTLVQRALVIPALVFLMSWSLAPSSDGADATKSPSEKGSAATSLHREAVPKPRLIVLADITNEPDDQQSLVRLLVYANEIDIEGLIATTSTYLRDRVRPDKIRELVEAYGAVRGNLGKHASGPASRRDLDAQQRIHFQRLSPPTDSEVARVTACIARRILRLLGRRGLGRQADLIKVTCLSVSPVCGNSRRLRKHRSVGSTLR